MSKINLIVPVPFITYNQTVHESVFNARKVIDATKMGLITGGAVGSSGYVGNQVIRKTEQIGQSLKTGVKTYKIPLETITGIGGAIAPQIQIEEINANN